MSNNREQRVVVESVHVLMGLMRSSKGEKKACIRSVDKGRGDELKMLEARLRILGGNWRIHRTVNARDVEKARKWLLKALIDYPERASFIDSEWRTALLQPGHIYGQKRFMLDVDTKYGDSLQEVEERIVDNGGEILVRHESPNGWHYITLPFDTRKVCELEFVTLLRDGYYFVKEVIDENFKETREHHWSGWPGAFCLDCGADDQFEICIAEHSVCITCIEGHTQCQELHEMQQCSKHKPIDCTRTKSNPNCGQCKEQYK